MTTMTVGRLAGVAGVTVRTLHHYDDIGLLVPAERSDSGYRIYNDHDIDRLQAILTYRELGLGLDEIALAIDRPHGSVDVLTMARRRIDERITKLQAIGDSLDAALANEGKESTMTPEEKLSVFGDFDPAEHEEEAQERWGDTEAFAQSTRRTGQYTKQDWETIQAEAAGIYQRFLELERTGVDPGSPQAAALVDEHRAHISRWFYDCTPEIHAGLGEMYNADQRFADSINETGDGLAAYMTAALAAAYRD
ncbi:MAG: MerR family transcriptional regulator [Acidimicrobiia bacterium]